MKHENLIELIGYTSENEVQFNCSTVAKIYLLYEYSNMKVKDYLELCMKMSQNEAWLVLESIVGVMSHL